MAPEDENLLRELYAGLAVLKSQQSEINRRLGNIDTKMENLVTPDRVASIEDELDERKSWRTWAFQVVGQVILVTALVLIGRAIGVEVFT